MSQFPKIRTAMPQRRYRYGDFAVTLLGEVDSADGRDYEFLMAFVRDGEAQPQLFVAAERLPPGQRADGSHRLRVINSAMDEIMAVDSRWGLRDPFAEQALQIGAQLLGLEQETVYPLG